MNVKKINEEVCKKLNIPLNVRDIPSDDEMEKLFDTLYKDCPVDHSISMFDDISEIPNMKDAFIKGYLIHLYQQR